MAQIVVMPKEGITVESCLISAWRKEIGDQVAMDDILFEYETDKAVFECRSTAEGTLLYRYFEQGDEAPVLKPVAVVGEPGETIPDITGDKQAFPEKTAAGAARARDGRDKNSFDGIDTRLPVEPSMKSPGASPRAKNLAKELGVDLSGTEPTGPGGRIIEADVIAAASDQRVRDAVLQTEAGPGGSAPLTAAAKGAEAKPAPTVQKDAVAAAVPAGKQTPDAEASFVDERFTKIRSVIAKTMMASLQRSAQVTNHHSFDATSILAMREDFKLADEAYGYRNVSVGDIILFVTSRILSKHPEINALVSEDGVRKYFTVNLGVAVDTPRGLMVPTIYGAEKKSLKEISEEVKTLAAAARDGRIRPDALANGTFTVSNLGVNGVEVFTPIINPPQAAILGVCGITERVRTGKDGGIAVYPSIGLSLSYDHRAIDGAPASRFAAELCEALSLFSWKTLALENEKG